MVTSAGLSDGVLRSQFLPSDKGSTGPNLTSNLAGSDVRLGVVQPALREPADNTIGLVLTNISTWFIFREDALLTSG